MRINSIQIKIISIIILVLTLAVAGILYISLDNQKKNLLSATEKTLSINTSMLNIVIRNLMLSGEAPIAQRTMDSLSKLEELEEIAIYRTDGSIAFHDYKTLDFVNKNQSKFKFKKTPRVENKMIMDESFQAVLESNTPKQVIHTDSREMEYFFPILNYKECRVCHGETNFIRGIAHFKISIAGIFNQIAVARRLLSGFFALAGIIMAIILVFTLRKLIIKPILKIGSAVGLVEAGNLDVSVTLPSHDELGRLASRINRMIIGLKERNKLMLENKIFETRIEESKKYLDNIQEGLLLLNEDMTISEQYSTFLTKLFKTKDIAGKNFIDFIYPDKKIHIEERKELEQFINLLFKNTAADMEMLLSVNPLQNKRLTIYNKEQPTERTEIVIDALFQRIMNNEKVENIMVIFKDLTDIVRTKEELERQRIRSQSEIEQISAILKAGPETFSDFIDRANALLANLDNNFDKLKEKDFINSLFRDLHSLKGTARYLEFTTVEKIIHKMEDLISEVRDDKKIFNDSMKREMNSLKAELLEETDNIKLLNNKFMDFARKGNPQNEEEKRVGKTNLKINTSQNKLQYFLDYLPRMVQNISNELGKSVDFKIENSLKNLPNLGKLKDPIIHIIRNSIDHGIEDTFERISKHKNERGLITLKLFKDSKNYVISITDDGKGIDFDMVKKKAIKKGIINENQKISISDLVSIIFLPNFSSKVDITTISGRGVGLDIVRDRIVELKGKISLKTEKDKGTTIIMRVPQ